LQGFHLARKPAMRVNHLIRNELCRYGSIVQMFQSDLSHERMLSDGGRVGRCVADTVSHDWYSPPYFLLLQCFWK
jgi:ribosome biogenesis protein Nip4